MQTTTTQHPTQQELQDFALGQLTGSHRHTVENHIAECDVCCKQLRTVPDDTFAERFKGGTPSQQDTRPADESMAGEVFHTTLPPELQNHPRYRVVKELGRGGMGVVYLAEHTFMERQVALKVIRANLVANSRAVDRFRQEVKAAAKLSHANIVTAHDAEQAGNLHFLVMEYIEGINLAKLVQKRGRLSVAQASNVMKQIARGLQHAYEKGMVHRDIKPQNLLITPKGQIKILDFGLARLLDNTGEERMTDAEMVLGTPDYIAPEQATNAQQADIRSDIYSLGCTFYYLLAGHPPFPEGTAMDKMIKHTDTAPKPIHVLRPDVPQAISDIVAKMMAKKPSARYQKPIELLQALTDVATVQEEPILELESVDSPAADTTPIVAVGSPTTPIRTPPKKRRLKKNAKRAKRQPVIIAGIVATVLLAIGGGAWGLVAALRDDANPTPKGNDTTPPYVAKNNNPPSVPKKTNGGTPNGQGKRVVLLIPSRDFWFPDYDGTRQALEAAGADVKVISTTTGMARHEAAGGGEDVRIDFTLDQATPTHYDALLVLGGSGVQRELLSSTKAIKLVQDTLAAGKLVGSQCVGAALLAEAGIFQEGQTIACPKQYNWAREAVLRKGVIITQQEHERVLVSGKIVTAREPSDGKRFAEAVWNVLITPTK